METHLARIADLLPPSYKVTLLARCTNEELADADMMLTDDTLPEVKAAVEKRIVAKENQ